MNDAARTYKTLRVFDLRQTDFFTGKKLPLGEDEGSTCARCGRLHAVVYEIQCNETQEVYHVGSTCCKKAFGFDPESDKIRLREIRKQQRVELEARRQAKIEELAKSVVAEVVALPLPEPYLIETRNDIKVEVWGLRGIEGAHVWVHLDWSSYNTFNEERRHSLYQCWISNEVHARVPASKISYEISCSAKDQIFKALKSKLS